ncbi:MAG: capsular polysaccharide transport system permease protein [Reinekea sp.]|jgi:capsular polysaccharide transport system permease protein
MPRSNTTRGDIPSMTPMRAILALILREMGSTYGDSPGGYIWAVIQPVGMIVILSFGFSLLVKAPSLGTSFILFYATGFLTYDIYNQMMSKVGGALKYSKSMLAYPRVTWLDAILARFILNVVTLLTVICIVISAILLFINTRTIISIQPILIGLTLCALLGAGIGMVNCMLAGLFPVWDTIWKILSRPMFIASGVIFIYEDMPPLVQDILWWNPILHGTGIVRTGFYPTYYASYVSLEYSFGVALTLVATGLLFLRSYHEKVLNR